MINPELQESLSNPMHKLQNRLKFVKKTIKDKEIAIIMLTVNPYALMSKKLVITVITGKIAKESYFWYLVYITDFHS